MSNRDHEIDNVREALLDQSSFYRENKPIDFDTLASWYGLKRTPIVDEDKKFNIWIAIAALLWLVVLVFYLCLYIPILANIVFSLIPPLQNFRVYVVVFALFVLVAFECTKKIFRRKKELKDDISANTAMYELVQQMFMQHIFPPHMEKDNFKFDIEKTGYKRYSIDFNLFALGLGNVHEMNAAMARVFKNMGSQNSTFSIDEEWEYGQKSFRYHVFLVMTNRHIEVDDDGARKLIPPRFDESH